MAGAEIKAVQYAREHSNQTETDKAGPPAEDTASGWAGQAVRAAWTRQPGDSGTPQPNGESIFSRITTTAKTYYFPESSGGSTTDGAFNRMAPFVSSMASGIAAVESPFLRGAGAGLVAGFGTDLLSLGAQGLVGDRFGTGVKNALAPTMTEKVLVGATMGALIQSALPWQVRAAYLGAAFIGGKVLGNVGDLALDKLNRWYQGT